VLTVSPCNPYAISKSEADTALFAIGNHLGAINQGAGPAAAAAINNLWVAVQYLTQQYHNNPVLQVAQRLEDSQC